MTESPATKLLAIVHERQRIPLEELLASCPELTWNQVFSLVDDLSRHALIGLHRRGVDYELRALSIVHQAARALPEDVSARQALHE
ncbi:MAG: hypothetical protein JNL29_09760 [Nitrospira sp.]|nr:hypothetical protein [Nitrospira sp.]